MTELTKEEVEALQQEATLSNEGLTLGGMTVVLTANCLHDLCTMALRSLSVPAEGWVAVSERDAKRLDWMDTLQGRSYERVVGSSKGGVSWPLPTDCHASAGTWVIYVRNQRNDIVQQGHGETIRAAIDRAMQKAEGGA